MCSLLLEQAMKNTEHRIEIKTASEDQINEHDLWMLSCTRRVEELIFHKLCAVQMASKHNHFFVI